MLIVMSDFIHKNEKYCAIIYVLVHLTNFLKIIFQNLLIKINKLHGFT